MPEAFCGMLDAVIPELPELDCRPLRGTPSSTTSKQATRTGRSNTRQRRPPAVPVQPDSRDPRMLPQLRRLWNRSHLLRLAIRRRFSSTQAIPRRRWDGPGLSVHSSREALLEARRGMSTREALLQLLQLALLRKLEKTLGGVVLYLEIQ